MSYPPLLISRIEISQWYFWTLFTRPKSTFNLSPEQLWTILKNSGKKTNSSKELDHFKDDVTNLFGKWLNCECISKVNLESLPI